MLGIGDAREERFEHRAGGLRVRVRGDAREFDPGVLEDFLEPLDRARALVGLRPAQPGEITQPPNLHWRYEARADQPVLDKLTDPLRVLDVGLAPGNVAQVVRVQKPALEPILERLEHRLPIHAGGLHPDQTHASLRQPQSEFREPGERRLERLGLLLPLATTAARHPDGRDHVVAMHVESRAPLHDHIHCAAPFETTVDMSPGGNLPRMSLSYALTAAINGPTGPRATLSHGL